MPEIVKALEPYHGNWQLDGEVVFLDPKTGKEKFTPCQRRCSTQYPDPWLRKEFPVRMEVFDILDAGGTDMRLSSYSERKGELHEFFSDDEDRLPDDLGGTLDFVGYELDLVAAWNEAVKKNREGLIAKQLESPYIEGDRSYNWLKVKNWRFEVMDVVGFTPGKRTRSSFFGSLVLAQDGTFKGCAGSGFNEWDLRRFKDLFSDAPRMDKPFSDTQVGETYTAVKVDLQVLVKFYQLTDSGVMRFPIFITD